MGGTIQEDQIIDLPVKCSSLRDRFVQHPDRLGARSAVTLKIRPLHRWDIDLDEATRLQETLAASVRLESLRGRPRFVAGADVAFLSGGSLRLSLARGPLNAKPTRVFAAVVVWDSESGVVVVSVTRVRETRFPYIPGYLSFREAPALLDAFAAVSAPVDAVICDGQGLAHPRRFGLACHVGRWLDLPTIGCAKSRLVGTHVELPIARGSHVLLVDRGGVVGEVVRTRARVKPVYVSPGNQIDVAGATELVLRCATRFRLPEPTRLADQLSKRSKRALGLPG